MNIYNQELKTYDNHPIIKSMTSCPSTSFQQNTYHTLTLNPSSGTPPYNYHWIISKPDGTIDTNLPNQQNISYLFDQNTLYRNYIVSSYVTDSCPSSEGGPKTSDIETCSVSVLQTPTPSCIPQPGEINIGGVCVSKNIIVASGIGVSALALILLLK